MKMMLTRNQVYNLEQELEDKPNTTELYYLVFDIQHILRNEAKSFESRHAIHTYTEHKYMVLCNMLNKTE